MAKADLIAAQSKYDSLVRDSRNAERDGEYGIAIERAKSAWPHVVDMMKYEKRYEAAEFKSLPCIDTVLRLAPPLLDIDSLDELASLLKANRSIDRDASDDLAARVVDARSRLRACYEVLGLFEAAEQSTLLQLLEQSGRGRSEIEPVVKELVSVCVLERSGRAGTAEIRLRRGVASLARAQCVHCGAKYAGQLAQAVAMDACPSCQRIDAMVLGDLDENEAAQFIAKGMV